MPRARKQLIAPIAVAAAAALAAVPAAAAATPRPKVEALSSRADAVTGGQALIGVQVPKGIKASKVQVRRNGGKVTGAFAPSPSDPRHLIGLVEGLADGPNRISALAKGGSKAGELTVYNSPISGPVLSGPHQSPFFCRTEDAGLGPPADTDCSAPTQVEYRYRSTGGGFKPLADPATRPADLAQTTTRDGATVDYVVRVESGVINRSVYRWAVLAPGGVVAEGWNGRLIHSFGGGCGAGYQQGASGIGTVLDDRELSRGFSVTSASLTVLGTACNDVLSAETLSMVKEHLIESLGRAPVWTLGEGGSGGSIQQQMIAQNYPGLLDGLLPSASFPDNSESKNPDCRLLQAYFATPEGAALSAAQKASITGLSNGDVGCVSHGIGADVINASEGCDESVVPPARIFDATTNPSGIRCTLWDSMVNIYGRDSATGYARRTLDNVGVQYGLDALREGDLSVGEFLDLNEGVGGFDDNGNRRPQRTVANEQALAIAYRTGRINAGGGGVPQVPIVDMRNYQDDEPTNVHQYISTFSFRQRLLETNGTLANHVMLRAEGGPNVSAMNDYGLDLISTWLDRIESDTTDNTLPEKVIGSKPADAVDACWIGGERIVEPAVVHGTGPCAAAYSPHSLPQLRAGKPLGSLVAKCRLRATAASDYPPMSPGQQARLAAIFPGGVCDWSQPGVEQQALGGTWISFGPDQRIKERKRALKLKATPRKPRGPTKVELTARLKPCPAVTWQRVRFEKRRGKGGWRSFDAELAEGRRCKAAIRLRLKRKVVLRASSQASSGFAGTHSKKLKLTP